jgi:hypothetical protein
MCSYPPAPTGGGEFIQSKSSELSGGGGGVGGEGLKWLDKVDVRACCARQHGWNQQSRAVSRCRGFGVGLALFRGVALRLSAPPGGPLF